MSKPILYSSLFGELTKNVQVRFDAISKMNKQVKPLLIYGFMGLCTNWHQQIAYVMKD